jgi:hypothetical protein
MTSPAATAGPAATPGWMRPVLYPFLIGVYPILFFYARNSRSIPPSELHLPIVIVLATTLAVWGLLALALRDVHRAGLLAGLGLVLFATIQNAPEIVKDVLADLSRLWVYRVRPVWAPPVIASELALAAFLAYRCLRLDRRTARGFTWPLNLFALALLVQPAIHATRIRAEGPARVPQTPAPLPKLARSQLGRPDIYYIVLDGFARADVLAGVFHYDLGPFLTRLERRGFYVARESTANYCQTQLSIPSSLNADYLHPRPGDESWLPQSPAYFRDNAVVSALRPLGYRFIGFATGFDFTDDPGVDVRLSPYPEVSGFQRLLLETTPLAGWLPNPMLRDSYTMTRERTEFLFDRLPEVARWKGPKFTVAHVLSPHPPFVFGEHGEDVSPHQVRYYLSDGNVYHSHYRDPPETFIRSYRAQASYLAARLERAIDGILANSARPPIIIIQSDHGSGLNLDVETDERTDLWERMSILNAYYFPGKKHEGLHPRITPVNSFRVMLNNYFGARLPLLPDENYFSSWAAPQQFIRVTDRTGKPPAVQAGAK